MKLFSFTAKYLPYCLPALLIFSRLLADIAVISIVILFLAKCFIEKDFSWLHTSWIKAFLAFLVFLVFINSPLSLNPLDSFFYSIAWIRWPLFAIALSYWIFSDKNSFNKLFFAIIVTFLFFISDLFFQFFIDDSGLFGLSANIHLGRLSVPLSDNVIPGRFICMYSFIFLNIYVFKQLMLLKRINNIHILSILFLSFLAVFITGERMSFLIFVSASLIFLFTFILFDKRRVTSTLIFITSCSLVVFFFYLFNLEAFNRTIMSTGSKITELATSDYGIVFFTSFEKFLNNPIFGSGLHQFQNTQPLYGTGILQGTKILHGHNLPLNLLVETGLAGLLLFYNIIFFIFLDIKNKLQRVNPLFLMLNLILLYICFFPLHSHFSLSHNWMNANIWFMVGLILALNNLVKNKT